ncbi:MAG TPA: LCP family protein, partial [Anaerolineae bacterium]
PTATPNGDWQHGQRVTVLVMGIDQRPVENASYANTDSLILLTMNPISKTAGMLSIPRDLWVNLTSHGQDRINTAMASGGTVYAMHEVAKVLGVPIHHYVRVNFTALQKLVDLIGGIDVYVDQDINDQQYPDMNYHFDPFVISAGMHHMDGATALKYARTRHNTSDFYRMRRQQQVILAVRDRVLSIDALPNLAANASEIMGTMAGAVVSDLSVPEMVQLALAAKDIPTENISKAVMDENVVQDYRTTGGAQVLILQPDKLPALIQRFNGQ